MPLTPLQVVEQETEKFLDSNFGQLDLSGCPSLLQQPSEEHELPDPRFAPLDDRGVGIGAAALKRGLEELANDPEVQEQVARETGDPEILEEYQNARAELAAREFLRQKPTYHRCNQNWKTIVRTLALTMLGWAEDEATAGEAQDELVRRGFWTVENLTAAF
jgi:hypothetical protein